MTTIYGYKKIDLLKALKLYVQIILERMFFITNDRKEKEEKMNKNKLLVKTLSGTLCAAMLMTNITPAFAATTENQSTSNETDTKETEVLYNKSASYFVTIPKVISLDSSKTSAYGVKVEGDIPSDREVYVSPIDAISDKDGFNFYMKDQSTKNAKKDVVANVTQSKFYWDFEDVANGYEETNNNISATDLSSGVWKGTFDFEINMHKIKNETGLTLSTDGDVTMGLEDSVQVNAYMDGETVTNDVTWTSNNSAISVENGLIQTNASAEVGDSAIITVVANNEIESVEENNKIAPLGIMTAHADEEMTASFKVTIVDIELSSYDLYIEPGKSATLNAKILPLGTTGTVNWTRTAVSGLNLNKNGNSVEISISSDMEVGKTYQVVASFGDFSKVCTIHVGNKETHNHNYISSVTKEPTCTEEGEKTYTCVDGDDSYTEKLPAKGHNYVNGTCSDCGEKDPNFNDNVELAAGLYDSNNTMLASWDELVNTYGLNIQKDYTNNTHTTTTSHLYYILNNNEEFANATNLVIDSSVVQIGDNALYGCSQMTKVTIPDSVLIIGLNAFQGWKLETIDIPSSVDSIENNAFAYSSTLTKAVVGARVIGENAFYCDRALTTLELKDGVEQIDDYAFAEDKKLEGGLELPSTVTNVGVKAFSNCENLTSAYLPSSIKVMAFTNKSYGPFYSCSSNLKLYCEPESQPYVNASFTEGWYNWNYWYNSELTTKWGVKRAVYEAVYK